MDIGLIIIGDEILHGDREDAHFKAVKTMLAVRGLCGMDARNATSLAMVEEMLKAANA